MDKIVYAPPLAINEEYQNDMVNYVNVSLFFSEFMLISSHNFRIALMAKSSAKLRCLQNSMKGRLS